MSLHGHVPPEPDLVQLLTPEGIRVAHPDFPLEITDDEIKSLYRDLVLVRRFDGEATALQRQGELGLWASCLGQEAAQVGAGRALRGAGHGLPDLPRARRGLVPRRRPGDPARHVPRGQPRRLEPEREQLQPLHHRARRADPARGRLRDGRGARRRGRHRRAGPGHRGAGLLRRRRVQPGRRQRGLHLGGRGQPAGGLLLPEQPVGDLGGGRAPEPGAAVPARVRLRLPRHPDRRQRRAGLPGGQPGGAGRGPLRAGPDPDRGLHLPDGRAHHLRRPDPVPARRTSWRPGGCATRSSGCGPTWCARPGSEQAFFDAHRRRVRGAGRPDPGGLPRSWRTRARCRRSTRSTSR